MKRAALSSSAGFAIVFAMFFLVIISFTTIQVFTISRRMPAVFNVFVLSQEALVAGRMAIDDAIEFFGSKPLAYFNTSDPGAGYYARGNTYSPGNVDWDSAGFTIDKARSVVQTANPVFSIKYTLVRMCYGADNPTSKENCAMRSLGGNRYELPMMVSTRITYTQKGIKSHVFHNYFTNFIFMVP